MAKINENSEEFIFKSITSHHQESIRNLQHSTLRKKNVPLSYTRARELFFDVVTVNSLRSGGASTAANAGVNDRLF